LSPIGIADRRGFASFVELLPFGHAAIGENATILQPAPHGVTRPHSNSRSCAYEKPFKLPSQKAESRQMGAGS